MAGKRRPLSPAQQVAVNTIKDTRRKFQEAKAETEARVRAQVREENAALELTYALAIRRAKELDVPKSTIGSEGMGTSDPHTVDRWLQKTERMVIQAQSERSTVGGFGWEDKAAGVVRVRYESFPTTITANDYPPILEGSARMDASTQTGWVVTDDPGTVETEMGPLRGWFSVEIEDVPTSQAGSLTGQLNEWVEENR